MKSSGCAFVRESVFKDCSMTCRNTRRRNLFPGFVFIRERNRRIMEKGVPAVTASHGCTTREEISIILNTGMITTWWRKKLSPSICRIVTSRKCAAIGLRLQKFITKKITRPNPRWTICKKAPLEKKWRKRRTENCCIFWRCWRKKEKRKRWNGCAKCGKFPKRWRILHRILKEMFPVNKELESGFKHRNEIESQNFYRWICKISKSLNEWCTDEHCDGGRCIFWHL